MARLEFQASKRPPVTLGGQVVVGRSADHAEIVIPDKRLSRRHCEFFQENGVWHVRDLKSANGTRVNGAEILEAQALKDNDEVSLGGVLLRFADSDLAKNSGLELDDSNRLELDDDEPPHAEVMPTLKVVTGTVRARLVKVDSSPFSIGRRDGNDLVLPDDGQASGKHAELFIDGTGKWRLRDLGSTNGSRVNGKITTDAELSDGARIQVGSQLFVFSLLGEEPQADGNTATIRKAAASSNDLFDDQDDAELEIMEDLDKELDGDAPSQAEADEVRRLEHAVVETQGSGKGKLLFRVLEITTTMVVLAALGWLLFQVSANGETIDRGDGGIKIAIGDGGLLDVFDGAEDHRGFGSFERKGPLDLYGWRISNRVGTDSGTFSDINPMDGGYFFEVIRTRPNIEQSRWIRDRFIMVPEEDGHIANAIAFSINYRRGATAGALPLVFVEWYADANETTKIYEETRGFVESSEEWAELSGNFHRPSTAKFFRFGVGVAGGAGRIHYDGAKVVAAKPSGDVAPELAASVGKLFVEVRPDASIQLVTFETARNVDGGRGQSLRRVEYMVNTKLIAKNPLGSQVQEIGKWLRQAPSYLDDGTQQIWTFQAVDPMSARDRSVEVRWDGMTLTINDEAPGSTDLKEMGLAGVFSQEFLRGQVVASDNTGIRGFSGSFALKGLRTLHFADMQGARELRFDKAVDLELDSRQFKLTTALNAMRMQIDATPIVLLGDQELIEKVTRAKSRIEDFSAFEREILRSLPSRSRATEAQRNERVEAAIALAKGYPFDAQALRFARAAMRDVVDFYRERMDDVRALVNEGGESAENPERFVASVLEAKAFAQGLKALYGKWKIAFESNTALTSDSIIPAEYRNAHLEIAQAIKGIGDLAATFESLVSAGRSAAFRIESRRQALDASRVLDSATALLADGENVQAFFKLRSIVRRFALTAEATRARELLLERVQAILLEAKAAEREGLTVIASEKRQEAEEVVALVEATSLSQQSYDALDIVDTYVVLGGASWIGMTATEWAAREAEIEKNAQALKVGK